MINRKSLLEGSLLAKNILFSFTSIIFPLIIGVISIPIILVKMGEARFGMLLIMWAIISYINLLDFGVPRSSLNLISRSIGLKDEESISSVIYTSTIIALVFGVVLSFILYFFSENIIVDLFKVENSLQSESIQSLKYIAVGTPLIFLTPVFQAFLKAYQRFKKLSILQILGNTGNFLIPIIVLSFSSELEVIIAFLLFLKMMIVLFLFLELKGISIIKRSFSYSKFIDTTRELLDFGKWVAVSNFITPLVQYLDRFFIVTYLSAAAVTVYATPLEVVLKISMVSVAITSVLFSALSNSIVHDKSKTEKLINRGAFGILCLVFPLSLTVICFAEYGLKFWVGEALADKGTIVAQIISIGVFFKSMTHLSIAFIHSRRNSKVTALIHFGELIIFLILLFILTPKFGLIGVAISHSLRLILDYFAMCITAEKVKGDLNISFLKVGFRMSALACIMLVFIFINTFLVKFLLWFIILVLVVKITYKEMRLFLPLILKKV